jgi:hypothetical protein
VAQPVPGFGSVRAQVNTTSFKSLNLQCWDAIKSFEAKIPGDRSIQQARKKKKKTQAFAHGAIDLYLANISSAVFSSPLLPKH